MKKSVIVLSIALMYSSVAFADDAVPEIETNTVGDEIIILSKEDISEVKTEPELIATAVDVIENPPVVEEAQTSEVSVVENTLENPDAEEEEISDPFKPVNRVVFSFNKTVDKAVLKPVAKVYDTVTPNFVQTGVRNFLNYLRSPINIVNYALQGNPVKLANSLGSFVANTFTLGLVDVAAKLKINHQNTSFGDTMGVWGVGKGPYLVLPILGSSSIRDTAGLVGADFPLSGLNQFPVAERNSLIGVAIVQGRSDLMKASDIADEAAFDAYEFEKSAWYQHRNYQEKNVKERE